MLKDIGFLRELSDSTSIVENPYLEVENEKVSRWNNTFNWFTKK